ncbi:hypothetical protein INT45_004049 [Circinella minor]|uniref:DH domain-containing protein n=1 Tax=Circinella minor TaxID=1195481 RepID=A0A8H7VF97_9FUNG|nr:hypothetical protein INT45_004049 [Circinella minor]
MLKNTRSASTTSTRGTIRTTTSSELSFTSSCSSSRLAGGTSSVSDASTAITTYSMEDSTMSPFRTSSITSSACPPNSVLYDTVDVIDELYDFFGNELDSHLVLEVDIQNRERILRELFDTEGRFIAKIQAALEYYKKPMMGSFRQNPNASGTSASSLPRNFLSSNKSAGMVRGNDVELVFSNLEDILAISRRFFNGLKERFRIWGPTQLLSDIFRTLVLDASSYYTYYENYGIAMCVLERLARTPATKKHVETMIDSTGSGQISLFSLLSLPLQSITRYAQLMNELVRYTDPHHPDAHQLSQCAKRMTRLEANMRHLIQGCQNVSRLVDMVCLIRNCPVLLDEPRQFIMRGQLTSVTTGSYNHRDDRRMYFLLNDCLIFARPRDDITPSALYFKGKIDLGDAAIKELPKKKLNHPHAFEITINSSDPNYKYADDIDALLAAAGGSTIQVFYFKADSKEALDMWIGEIQSVIDRLNPPRR